MKNERITKKVQKRSFYGRLYGKNINISTKTYKVMENLLHLRSEFTTLHVPAACLDEYKTTEPWSEFKEIVL